MNFFKKLDPVIFLNFVFILNFKKPNRTVSKQVRRTAIINTLCIVVLVDSQSTRLVLIPCPSNVSTNLCVQ